MSKAAEWAKTQPDRVLATTFRPIHPEQVGLVMVERNGGCYLELTHGGAAFTTRVGASLEPAVALAVARWILDTFEDRP